MDQENINKFIPMTSINSGSTREVAPDIAYYTNQIVNLVMIGPRAGPWVLIDTGMPKSAKSILKAVEERFGEDVPPVAIILTHGHFDHVGNVVDLVSEWNVPVYAHPMEFPFLTGKEAYPEPDTTVEGGLLAKISSIYPNEPIDISDVLQVLPAGGIVPHLAEWRWLHVPGHSPGQVALFRERDRVLISADAFITVKQDSMYRVLVQKEEICGPPVYLTTDWALAHASVSRLAALDPQIVISGHGTAMEGEELKQGLVRLVNNWKEEAVPDHGKWVKEGNQ
ncbi:MAG: MBL fold metallo-hydrolase [Pseudobacter sp.]|uniref:MBL fold metallo-hydrolase n=1 Tax=Pseudobacter sp. TaxID=2045420 RepID=UPI003F8188CC